MDVAAAKEFALQNDWTISMDTANTQDLVEAYVLAQLDAIIPDDVETVLEMGEVIPASEGTMEDPEGTDGTPLLLPFQKVKMQIRQKIMWK